ncbi:MAG: hypothetical protein HKP12_11645 [Gammaproteobacteria bacterium]|nr:hypothetical protein [Gammaproteobacteria bacterium]
MIRFRFNKALVLAILSTFGCHAVGLAAPTVVDKEIVEPVSPPGTTERLNSANDCSGIASWAFDACNKAAGLRLSCDKVQRDTEADCQSLASTRGDIHVVSVYQDGSFAPAELFIKDGDTVLWSFYDRGEAIIPVDVDVAPITPTGKPDASICQAYKVYDPQDPNEFTGPMRRTVSGIFVLNRERKPGDDTIPTVIEPELTDADFTGALIRMKWSDVHLGPGTFDWSHLDQQIEELVDSGKMYSLVFKAGQKCTDQDDTQVCAGTPEWIFDSSVTQASAATKLELMSAPSFPDPGSCGVPRTLGSPADPNYRTHYFELLQAAAQHLMEKNAWYQSLAYIKPSGANLFSAENRLPNQCWSPTDSGLTEDECNCTLTEGAPSKIKPCVCNPQIWSVDGNYTPAALYEFYSLQTGLLARAFPDKDMSYMLIQAGFPLINDAGEYEGQNVVDEKGKYSSEPVPARAPLYPLPGETEQTVDIIKRGFAEHGYRFAVQHNALKDDGTPNKQVRDANITGLFTGYQTVNDLGDADRLGSALDDALEFNAVFVEVYQKDLIDDDSARAEFDGKSLAAWDSLFHQQRRGDNFREKAGDPFPLVHGHTFTRTLPSTRGNQTLQYVVSPRCKENPQIGKIHILPN